MLSRTRLYRNFCKVIIGVLSLEREIMIYRVLIILGLLISYCRRWDTVEKGATMCCCMALSSHCLCLHWYWKKFAEAKVFNWKADVTKDQSVLKQIWQRTKGLELFNFSSWRTKRYSTWNERTPDLVTEAPADVTHLGTRDCRVENGKIAWWFRGLRFWPSIWLRASRTCYQHKSFKQFVFLSPNVSTVTLQLKRNLE